MQLFSALLDINDRLTEDDFIRLAIEWNRTSTHPENIVSPLVWHGEHNARYGNPDLWLEIREFSPIIAIRHEKRDADGRVWDSDFVMNFQSRKMGIRLERRYLTGASNFTTTYSSPHFITLLIEGGYLEDDGDLPVLRAPHLITGKNTGLLADLASGTRCYHLPVVYVSKTFQGKNPLDANLLSSQLKGIAHVLLQESPKSNLALKNTPVETNGAVGLFFPARTLPHLTFHPKQDKKALQEEIRDAVTSYANNLSMDALFTWQGVQGAMLMNLVTQARKDQREADTLLDLFEQEEKDLQEQNRTLRGENEALRKEVAGLRKKQASQTHTPLLYSGEEHDLYPGEIKDLVLSLIKQSLQHVPTPSRRADLITDLLNANDYQALSEQIARDLKRILTGYTRVTTAMKDQLKALGFEISDEGKHYKLVYHGDPRYWASLGCTPSDYRSGRNNAQEIIKRML